MNGKIFIAVLFFLLGTLHVVYTQTVTSQSLERIVICIDHPLELEEKQAVADLQDYLGRIFDRFVPVINDPPDPLTSGSYPLIIEEHNPRDPVDLGRDGFSITVGEDSAVISGGTKFGRAYGIYEFLEQLGVRWLFPGEWGEVVPAKEDVVLSVGTIVSKPGFLIRDMRSWSMKAETRFADWARRQRHNRCGFNGHSNLMFEYRNTHPEWFAEIHGVRRPHIKNPKLCHSNREMVSQAVEDVLRDIRALEKSSTVETGREGFQYLDRDRFVYSVSPSDGGGFCQCDECQAMGSLSDRLQIFANTIAEAVSKEFPHYFIGYYGAYSAHKVPPSVEAHPNVIVFATTWGKDFFTGLSYPKNRDLRDRLESFSEVCPRMAIRDYDGMFTSWWGWGPVSLIEAHAEDYPWYHRHGVLGINTEAQDHWAAAGQSYYVMSKLWWDPYADVEQIKRDFVEKGFGTAFAPMWRYYERINAEKAFLRESTLLAMRHDLEEAYGLAVREDVKKRIMYLRLYHFTLHALQGSSMGSVSEKQLREAVQISRSLVGKNIIAQRFSDKLIKAYGLNFGPFVSNDGPLTFEEMAAIIEGEQLPEKQPPLPEWNNSSDKLLGPLVEEGPFYKRDMEVKFRYLSHEIVLYVSEGEIISVDKIGKYKDRAVDYTLHHNGQTVSRGILRDDEPLSYEASEEGVYVLNVDAKGNWTELEIQNQYAVIKASSFEQRVHPITDCTLFFYVPEGTKQFALVARAYKGEPYELALFAPHFTITPVTPKTEVTSTSFIEHRITVPDGADGEIWKMVLTGEDKEFYVKGIPPFVASHPVRLLKIAE